LLLILAPRRPDRFDLVAGKLGAAGIPFVRRSQLTVESRCGIPGVFLLDTIGELASLFQRADVVFMGGTLARRGGHNILEPAYFGKPVIVGPHMENFAEIANEFLAGGGLLRICTPDELSGAIDSLLTDPRRRNELGVRAQTLAVAKRGVVDRVAAIVTEAAEEGVPQPIPILWKRILLTPLTWAWALGHKINMQRGAQRSLATRVISIGGLSMGGVGKSPMVAYIAERLQAGGLISAILTRGYRRESNNIIVVPKGGTAAVEQTGDEAQMFVRQDIAHVGIGANRFEVGHKLERELKPDMFLLDDGFQHFGLTRDQDIVLIDAQNPFAGGLFPLGLRREPLSGLARATAIIITRADLGTAGLERIIREYNREAPIYRSRMVVTGWDHEPAGKNVAAFCGIGSPTSFWRTLQQVGFTLVLTRAFRDHHKYDPEEMRQLASDAQAAGASALVTTEKDMMNLCEGAAQLVAPLKICCLKIGVEIENEDDLLRQIVGKPS
jgi:tetraacyldisaccharide 4'-kinase